MVLFWYISVFYMRLARENARHEQILSGQFARDRPRHLVLLGRSYGNTLLVYRIILREGDSFVFKTFSVVFSLNFP